MAFAVLILALVIGIALYQALHGVFSTVIMLVLTACCLAFAFGTYEWVAINWLSGWRPDFAFCISLALCFGLPLIVLRLLFDQTIRRAPLVPAVIDKAGAGVCGLLIALMVSGVLATALQMVPFNGSVMGYSRLDVPSKEKEDDAPDPSPPDITKADNELILTPDRFAVGVASMMSGGIFSGSRKFSDDNPDFIQSVGWVHNTRDDVSRYAPPNSFHVDKIEMVEEVGRYAPKQRRVVRRGRGAGAEEIPEFTKIPPASGNEYRLLTVKIDRARLNNAFSRVPFTLRQFRIVGQVGNRSKLEQFYAVAIRGPYEANRYIREDNTGYGNWHVVDNVYQPLQESPSTIELVFELPENFRPVYMAFKQGATTDKFPGWDGVAAAPERPTAVDNMPSTTLAASDAPTVPSAQGGTVRKFTTFQGSSFFGDKLPVELTQYQNLRDAEVSRGKLSSGSILAMMAEQGGSGRRKVNSLDVPDDKRLLHLDVKHLEAKNLLAKAMSKAVGTVQNYSVIDDKGNTYRVIGKYAFANVNGEEVFEVQYFPNQAGSIGGLGQFSKIQDRHLKDDYQLVFLFVVDPGVRITHFTTGGRSARRDDLTGENLVAPE